MKLVVPGAGILSMTTGCHLTTTPNSVVKMIRPRWFAATICLLLIAASCPSLAAEQEQRFATPEATFHTAMEAIARGKHQAFCQCFTKDGLSHYAGRLRFVILQMRWLGIAHQAEAGGQDKDSRRDAQFWQEIDRIERRYLMSRSKVARGTDRCVPKPEPWDALQEMQEIIEAQDDMRKVAKSIKDHTGYVVAVLKLLNAKTEPPGEVKLQDLKIVKNKMTATGIMRDTSPEHGVSNMPITFRHVDGAWKIDRLHVSETKTEAKASATP